MTLLQLKYAVMIADCGSMNEAAKNLFLSQPSLSKAVKELEKEMKLTIFDRTNKGIEVSPEGNEFLAYARQVLEQTNLLEEKYLNEKPHNPRFSVSAQHYSFAVDAFVDVIRMFGQDTYDFTLRETTTHEIIEDVAKLKSEIGILYTSTKNDEVIRKMIKQNNLVFEELFTARPHVFISAKHPLAIFEHLTLQQLEEYPYLSFEQGDYNSFYFSEEVLSTLDRKKNIKVRDRATLFNLVVGLNGYTVSTGILSKELNGESILARPLDVKEEIHVGTIRKKNMPLDRYGKAYLESLQRHCKCDMSK